MQFGQLFTAVCHLFDILLLLMARVRYRRLLFGLGLCMLIILFAVNVVVRQNKVPLRPTKANVPLNIIPIVDNDYPYYLPPKSSDLLNKLNDSNTTKWFNQQQKQNFQIHWLIENNNSKSPLTTKPWFMRNGTTKLSSKYANKLAIWPEETIDSIESASDRIVNQLMYVPEGYDQRNFVPQGKLPLKRILLYFGKGGWGELAMGRRKFIDDNCPVNSCYLLDNTDLIDSADAVIFKDRFVWPKYGRLHLNQLWILFLLECPLNTQLFTSLGPNVINWTATYRHDSDLVTPYEKYVQYSSIGLDPSTPHSDGYVDLFESTIRQQSLYKRNYAAGKTKKVAWFVSNCGARNKRLEYARELSRHIEVDIFGSCGLMKCPRAKSKECFDMLNRDYKFYLAFENSNCRDYITEKFFVNSLGHNSDELNVVPIVMGGHPDDYRRAAPSHSFIHVDQFKSPEMLANFLKQIDADDEAYNRYFEWKSQPRKGEFINTYFWCRLCALLHAPAGRRKPSVSYANLAKWWAPKNVCNDGSKGWSM